MTEGPTPEVGARDRVGRYELRERIGAGGMGIVYAAWDPELDRRVALKFIRPGRAVSPELLARRLRREAQAMARLRHDNVVAVYDVGESADGQLFVAMEYVDGVSLRKWLRAKPRSVVEILAVFRAAGEGLAAAHAEGLTHRDFKPDNVLVANDGKALVLDFGLASWATSPGSDAGEPSGTTPIPPEGSSWPSSSAGSSGFKDPNETSLTKPGAVLGTPKYMAPEQQRGQAVDARSDQFAFCVALWQALTGELPYGPVTSRALARARVGKLGKLNRKDVPAHVERALRRGLSWRAEDRWPDMRALLGELAASSRRRWWWLAVPAALILGAALSFDRSSPTAALDCGEQSERMSEVWNAAVEKSLAKSFSVRGELARESWPFVRSDLDDWSKRWTTVDLELCERYGQGVAPELYERQLLCMDRARDRFGLAINLLESATTEEIERSFELLSRLPDPSNCREAPSVERPGVDHERFVELERAIDQLELEVQLGRHELAASSSVELFTATQAPGLEDLHMRVVEERSDALTELERHEESVDVSFSGLTAAERDGTAALRLRAFIDLALTHLNSGQDLQTAERFLAQAKAISAESDLVPAIQHDLAMAEGWIVGVGGRPDLAVLAFERALTFIDPAIDTLEYAEATMSRAHMLGYLDRGEEALEQFSLAERELMQLVGPQHPLVLDMRVAKGHARMRIADWAGARKELLEASAALEVLRGGPTTETLSARALAAWVLNRLGDCKGALAEYEQIIPLAREQMPYPGPDLGDVLNRRAEICNNQSPEAIEFAREALALYREALGDEHVMVASARTKLARTLYEAGEREPALEEVDTALAIYAAIHPIGSEFVPETKALRMLIRHALGEPDALEGIAELLAGMPKKHVLTQRLEALR